MPINPKGPIWFVVTALTLGGWASLQLYLDGGNSAAFRRSLPLVLMS